MGNKLRAACALLSLFFTLNFLNAMVTHREKRISTASQQFLMATLADAFIKNNYTTVQEILETHCSKLDINRPLTHQRWQGRVLFNIIHNEYVRRHSKYYPKHMEEECYSEYLALYYFFCDRFHEQINVNIKDTNSDRMLNDGWEPENDKTPLMYIIDRLLACTESIKTIKNIFIEFLIIFGKQVDPTLTNQEGKTIFEMCAILPHDNEIMREKKEFIYDMLAIMTRRKFITPCLYKLHNCHFRFEQP